MSAYTLAPSAALKSAKRGSAKRAGVYSIEGETVTADGLAARLNMDKDRALRRLATVKAKPGPVTWAKLGAA
jgi:hypothetical protein